MDTQKSTQTKHFRSNGSKNSNGSKELGQNTQDAATGEKGSVVEAAQDGSIESQKNYTPAGVFEARPVTTLLTAAETAVALRVSIYTVRRRIADGTIKAVKIGAHYRIRRAEIDRLIGEPTKQHKRLVAQVEKSIVLGAIK